MTCGCAVDSVVELLGPGGVLARAMPRYEVRDGQLAMALAVQNCLECSEILLCEAGTGTGKTLAYLVPAIVSGQKVVVSTATKALQEQIVHQDLPTIAQYLQLTPKVVVAKGLGNYLCLRRFEAFRKSPRADDAVVRRVIARIEKWLEKTSTGDVAELAGVSEREGVWLEICSSVDTRHGLKCPYYQDCFVTRMRREAEAAQLVIANHHLAFADVAVRRGSQDRAGVLPSYEAIIFDEAHQIEDIASDFFGVRVSLARVDALLRDALLAFGVARASTDHMLESHEQSIVHSVRVGTQELFDALYKMYKKPSESGKIRLESDSWLGPLQQLYHRVDEAVEVLQQMAASKRSCDEVQMIETRALDLRNDLARVVEGHPGDVTWIEFRTRSVAIGATPLQVGSMLRTLVFERVPASVLTSATLTTGAGFSFFRSRLGVDSDQCETRELQVPSPFDYESNALLYTPTDLPDPGEADFTEKAAQRTAQLIELSDGGVLVLCTSYRAMGVVFEVLKKQISNEVLMQGQGPKTSLVERFRDSGRAVLVATMSFWQGVDIAGQALRMVVIDKLPFAVPSDPVVMARCAALQEQGENPFVKYLLPSAAITLKKGFGRLIRTRQDRGVVAVLDKRIVQKGYGKTLLKALPPAPRATELLQVQQFWQYDKTT